MSSIVSIGSNAGLASSTRRPISDGWAFCSTDPDALGVPAELDRAPREWCAVRVPCTVASVLGAAAPVDFDEQDHWFRCGFDGAGWVGGAADLVCDGLATICEVWLNGERLGESTNMFVRSSWEVGPRLLEQNELVLCFRALGPRLRQRHARARWRTQLAESRNLRFYRTTLLGRMSSWCPPVAPVGPWRAVTLVSRSDAGPTCERVSLKSRLEGGTDGTLDVAVEIDLGTDATRLADYRFSAEVEGIVWPLEVEEHEASRIRVVGTGRLPDVDLWWPHTQGQPRLYGVTLRVSLEDETSELEIGRVGFRTVAIGGDPSAEFRIEVNGARIFCRGTCWTPVDAMGLQASPEALRSALEQARDAGMNMLRVPGTTIYEDDVFYQLCDELGILVWQDFMFATFDYPAEDESFMASVTQEVEQFLDRTESRACLAVLCGNSEGQQQPAMLGLEQDTWTSALFDSVLPALCEQKRPDLPYWTSTPSGGDLPFHTQAGTSHYFGVGAYRRPLSDALLARPRFITECLALSNTPGESGPDATPPERVPRDRGADWDFQEVTDHYVTVLFGEEASWRARENPEWAADLRRATSAQLMERTQALWRDPASTCQGSLVWLHRDPWPCAGWGIIGAEGRPKSAYYGLRRSWLPIAIAILDEGLNGLRVQIHNDLDQSLQRELEIVLMRLDGTRVRAFREAITVDARSTRTESIDALLGGFVDSSHAYHFGAREFDVCIVRLRAPEEGADDPVSALSRETIHMSHGIGLLTKEPVGLRVEWVDARDDEMILEVSADRFVQCISLSLEGALPEDNFFHLAPDCPRRIRVRADATSISGVLRALNAEEVVEIPVRVVAPRSVAESTSGR